MEIPVEKKFHVLSEIVRASHFEWLRAVKALAPQLDEAELVREYWQEVGRDTAQAYLPHIDREKPLPEQVARSFSFSSQCMGEDCGVKPGKDENEYFAEHTACPWFERHKKEGKPELDLPGCDAWLQAVVAGINEELGSNLRVETLKSLPDGDDVCLRRFWVE
jgi:hypothetical protein